MSGKIDTTLRRFCKTCGRAIVSRIDEWGDEVCAEHLEPVSEEEW